MFSSAETHSSVFWMMTFGGKQTGGQRRWAADQEGALDRKVTIRRHTRADLLTSDRAEKTRIK